MNSALSYENMMHLRDIPPGQVQTGHPLERANRILRRAEASPLRLNVERALYFTESMRRTEHLPLPLRWALGMAHVMESMQIHILPDELIVGRGSGEGFYGIFYPELEGAYFACPEHTAFDGSTLFAREDIERIKTEIVPYWEGRTYHDGLFEALPRELRHFFYENDDRYKPSFIAQQSATLCHSLQWSLDYRKIIERGFVGIQEDAERHLSHLSSSLESSGAQVQFYTAIVTLCQGVRTFAERHALLADQMAANETDPVRAAELRGIAERCRRVPYYPARTFVEAIQAQWFTQLVSRLEQIHGGGAVGNGRIDQYLWPLYKKDIEAGILTPDEAVGWLNLLWANMAQFLCLQPNPSGLRMYQEHNHWEFTTIGGQTPEGEDATNELTYLVLRSAADFPLDYPYLGMRVHKDTPNELLDAASRALVRGRCIPVLLNDEEIIPMLEAKGGSLAEARDYCGSGYSEVRMINRNTYFTGTTWINLIPVLEMAISDGCCSLAGGRQVGLPTGEEFEQFEDVCAALERQLEFLVEKVCEQQYIADAIRTRHVASPLVSALHDLCMEHGRDVNEGRFPGEVSMGGQIGVVGFATLIDSLMAIRELVFERKIVTLEELRNAVRTNFEGRERLRQFCMHAPRYGDMNPIANSIGKRLDSFLVAQCEKKTNFYGGTPEICYMPVRGYLAMGSGTGASPDGRLAGEELSYGVSPTRGKCAQGPTIALESIARAKGGPSRSRSSRPILLEMTPQSLSGEVGIRALRELIACWCEQRHWFLRLRVTNNDDWVACINYPKRFREVLVRYPGYSASHQKLPLAALRELLVNRNDGQD